MRTSIHVLTKTDLLSYMLANCRLKKIKTDARQGLNVASHGHAQSKEFNWIKNTDHITSRLRWPVFTNFTLTIF